MEGKATGEMFGPYAILPAANVPGWYAITVPDAQYPNGEHLVALADSNIGAATMIVGVLYVQALLDGKPEEIKKRHAGILQFLAALE